MIKKRGISVMISVVLIIGLTITVATGVWIYAQGQAERSAKSMELTAEDPLYCDNVYLSTVCDPIKGLMLKNKGYRSIYKIMINGEEFDFGEDNPLLSYAVSDDYIGVGEKLKDLSGYNIVADNRIIPMIQKEDGDYVVCSSKALTITQDMISSCGGEGGEYPLIMPDCIKGSFTLIITYPDGIECFAGAGTSCSRINFNTMEGKINYLMDNTPAIIPSTDCDGHSCGYTLDIPYSLTDNCQFTVNW